MLMDKSWKLSLSQLVWTIQGPEHCYFNEIGRATYDLLQMKKLLGGFKLLSRLEGIIPALESSHAIAGCKKWQLRCRQAKVSSSASGRGDKNVMQLKNVSEAEAEGK